MSIPVKHMLADLADRERLADNLFEFAWEVVLRNIPNKVPGLHHALKTKRLEQLLVDKAMQDLYIGEPPRSGKTLYGSLAFPAWAIGRNPRLRIIIASSTTNRAELLSGNVRDLLADPEYQRIFPDAMLNPASLARGNWTTTAGGSMLGAGVGMAIQGAAADLVIIDDPYASMDDAFSTATRASITSWYLGTMQTRLEPGAKLVLICQRMHRNDLAGAMMDNFNLRMAEHDKDATKETGRHLSTLILQAECENPDTDPLGRKMGELLWPTHHDAKYLATYREDDYVWRTLYQQFPPNDDGDWAGAVQFGTNPPINSSMTIYMASDVADNMGRGDATVHVIVGHDRVENLFYVLDMWREQTDVATGAQGFLEKFERWKPIVCLVEDDAYTKSLLIHVRNMAPSKNLHPFIKEYSKVKSKDEKASAFRGMMVRGMWRFDSSKPWTERILYELRRYPNGTTAAIDDCVDALGLIGRHLSKTSKEPPPPPPKPRLTRADMCLEHLFEDNENKGIFRPRI